MSIVTAFHNYLSQRDPLRFNPRALEQVEVRALDGFWHAGAVVEPGTMLRLQRFDAETLSALGKVEILS